jgi:hypothetical protein
MARQGFLDLGCGKYSYSIEAPPPPPPEPTTSCTLTGSVFFYDVYLAFPSGEGVESKVRNEMGGCGAITEWTSYEDSGTGHAHFKLPLLIKKGCVERALKTATGIESKPCY